MPTVLTIGGLRVVIFPNDHRPAHVHVQGNGSEAVFNLNCPHGPPEVRENYGFSKKQLGKIVNVLAVAVSRLCVSWRQIHGSD